MNFLNEIAKHAGEILSWLNHAWQNFGNVLLETACIFFREWLTMVWHVLGVIPVPEALAHFTWPDVGPLGPVLVACGVPEAFAILSAAGTLKLALSVVRLL